MVRGLGHGRSGYQTMIDGTTPSAFCVKIPAYQGLGDAGGGRYLSFEMLSSRTPLPGSVREAASAATCRRCRRLLNR